MIQLEILTSDKEVAKLCELFWEVDTKYSFVYKIAELAEIAGVHKKKLVAIINKSCHAHSTRWICNKCFKPYRFTNRTNFKSSLSIQFELEHSIAQYYCPSCQERINKREQDWFITQEKATRISRDKIKKSIKQYYGLNIFPEIKVKDLSIVDAMYLLSLLRAGANESLTKILPVREYQQPLTPNLNFTGEVIKHLFRKKIISVDPDNEPEAFARDDIKTIYLLKAMFIPSIRTSSSNNSRNLILELLNILSNRWSEAGCQDALQVWKKIALSECEEYLSFILNEFYYDFPLGEKTNQYLGYALEHLSTAQVFNLIWQAKKNAAALFRRNSISSQQAANSTIAYIQRISEKAVLEKMNLKPFGRSIDCPQTCLSEVFYNSVLMVGDVGFKTCPNLEFVCNKKSVQVPRH